MNKINALPNIELDEYEGFDIDFETFVPKKVRNILNALSNEKMFIILSDCNKKFLGYAISNIDGIDGFVYNREGKLVTKIDRKTTPISQIINILINELTKGYIV